MTDSLHDAIDKSAKDMLDRCAKEVDGRPIPMTQQVEAFVAIVKWAETREKIRPKEPEPEKEESTYERLQRQFHGKQRPRARKPAADDGAAERRGTNHEAEAEADTGEPSGASAAERGHAGEPSGDDLLDGANS